MIALDKENQDPAAKPLLSPRQAECLRGVVEFKSAKEIARDLGISPHAVEKHLRLCREKLGVATSAEAARIYARAVQGSDFPHYDVSHLVAGHQKGEQGLLPEQPVRPHCAELEDTYGALSPDHQLNPRQTLLAIAAISFLSIVGLLLLVASAEGIRRLVSG